MATNEFKATERQKELVNVLYTVHENLRKRHRIISSQVEGTETQVSKDDEQAAWNTAWESHKRDKETLEGYAVAMYELATEIWDPRNVTVSKEQTEATESTRGEIKCRLEWVAKKCTDFFGNRDTRLKLIDVGSCYNPFSRFSSLFDITAVDLYPAAQFRDVVYQCDFLEVAELPQNSAFELRDLEPEMKQMLGIPKEHFDVVVFSFVLEYLPDTRQRRLFCMKAQKFLKDGGLLFILRPDSNSASEGNIRLIKRLKVGLALLGMKRVYCEKLQHVWCSAYVKLEEESRLEFEKSKRFQNDLKKVSFDEEHELFAIPQDFKHIELECEKEATKEVFDTDLVNELPLDLDLSD